MQTPLPCAQVAASGARGEREQKEGKRTHDKGLSCPHRPTAAKRGGGRKISRTAKLPHPNCQERGKKEGGWRHQRRAVTNVRQQLRLLEEKKQKKDTTTKPGGHQQKKKKKGKKKEKKGRRKREGGEEKDSGSNLTAFPLEPRGGRKKRKGGKEKNE